MWAKVKIKNELNVCPCALPYHKRIIVYDGTTIWVESGTIRKSGLDFKTQLYDCIYNTDLTCLRTTFDLKNPYLFVDPCKELEIYTWPLANIQC